MVEFTRKSELDSLKPDNKKSHNAGEIYPQIFEGDAKLELKEGMLMEAGIIWLGGYMLDSSLFPKEKCPVCGKEEVLIPYQTIGSVLSGCHTIKFYCTNCHEQVVTNRHIEYFRKIYRYVMANRANLPPEKKAGSCSTLPTDTQLI